jgi:hypothetical protein
MVDYILYWKLNDWTGSHVVSTFLLGARMGLFVGPLSVP